MRRITMEACKEQKGLQMKQINLQIVIEGFEWVLHRASQ